VEAFRHALPYYAFYFSEFPHFARFRAPFDLSWSLGIEEKFYLLWPALAFGLLRLVRIRMIAACALLLVTLLLPSTWGASVFLRPYGLILVGCVAALALHSPDGYRAARGLGAWQLPLFAGLIGACVVVGDPWLPVLFEPLVALFTVLLLVATMVRQEGLVARTLSRQPLVKVGGISYGIYLIHQLCLNAIEKVVPSSWGIWGGALLAIAGGTAAVIGALVLSRVIEQPLIRIGRRLAARRQTPVVAAANEAELRAIRG
jgi:peptidoglycan/LPS O-acetylase OafA/YrhL